MFSADTDHTPEEILLYVLTFLQERQRDFVGLRLLSVSQWGFGAVIKCRHTGWYCRFRDATFHDKNCRKQATGNKWSK